MKANASILRRLPRCGSRWVRTIVRQVVLPVLATAALQSSSPAQDIPWGWQWPGQTEAFTPLAADFDGDGKADRCMVERQTGRWYIIHSSGTDPQGIWWGWQWAGQTEDFIPFAADFDGDGKADRCMVNQRTGQWYIIHSTGTNPQNIWWGWQWAGQTQAFTPFAADFDGDGKADRCMVNRTTGQWYIIHSSGTNPQNIWWGWQWAGQTEAFTPFAADFDGDGKADRCMVERQTGRWYIIHSSGTDPQNIWWGWNWLGQNDRHIPFAADFDGDRKADRVLVERFAGLWHVLYSGNKPPLVEVGGPLAITLNQEAQLAGVVSDDGRPNPPGVTSVEWSRVSGPGTVTFQNRFAAQTQARFYEPGVYLLGLTANDGALKQTKILTVTVAPNSPVGPPPFSVSAGNDTSATIPGPALLKGSASAVPADAKFAWTVKSGPGPVSFQPQDKLECKAYFSVAGDYTLTLTGTASSRGTSDDVRVLVKKNEKPVINAGSGATLIFLPPPNSPPGTTLRGSVTDTTLPYGTLSSEWVFVSGPAKPYIANPTLLTTYVSFPKIGTYRLKLTATDDDLWGNPSEVVIEVKSNAITFPR